VYHVLTQLRFVEIKLYGNMFKILPQNILTFRAPAVAEINGFIIRDIDYLSKRAGFGIVLVGVGF
jgi:hypothetical protein